MKKTQHANEVAKGKRFEFGKNWNKFLTALNDERIAEAEKSLKQMLEVDDLKGKSFLDIGYIFDFYKSRYFILRQLKTCGCGLGNNEFIFEKKMNVKQ